MLDSKKKLLSLITGGSVFASNFLALAPAYAFIGGVLREGETKLPGQPSYAVSQQTQSRLIVEDACTNSFINTGVTVATGTELEIRVDGIVRFGFFVGSGGPQGILIGPSYNFFVDVPHGAVLGRISQSGMRDTEGWFLVGEGIDMVAQSSGTLQFLLNDNQPQDNAGQFCIDVADISSPAADEAQSDDFESCVAITLPATPDNLPETTRQALAEHMCRVGY